MKEGISVRGPEAVAWIGALLALPVVIIGSFPFDPVTVNIIWTVYFFATELVLIVALLALFLYKMMRRNDPISP